MIFSLSYQFMHDLMYCKVPTITAFVCQHLCWVVMTFFPYITMRMLLQRCVALSLLRRFCLLFESRRKDGVLFRSFAASPCSLERGTGCCCWRLPGKRQANYLWFCYYYWPSVNQWESFSQLKNSKTSVFFSTLSDRLSSFSNVSYALPSMELSVHTMSLVPLKISAGSV